MHPLSRLAPELRPTAPAAVLTQLTPSRRAADPVANDETLTITRADLADALRRTMMCSVPAITEGAWNVLRHEAEQRALQRQEGLRAERDAALVAGARTRRQQDLETVFGGQP